MAGGGLTIHATLCICTEAELTARLAKVIADHVGENRHPDGIAPWALAEDIVVRLRRGLQILVTREDQP